jgi:hypothetical protein
MWAPWGLAIIYVMSRRGDKIIPRVLGAAFRLCTGPIMTPRSDHERRGQLAKPASWPKVVAVPSAVSPQRCLSYSAATDAGSAFSTRTAENLNSGILP